MREKPSCGRSHHTKVVLPERSPLEPGALCFEAPATRVAAFLVIRLPRGLGALCCAAPALPKKRRSHSRMESELAEGHK